VSLRFGTDGVRGVAGAELTPELTTALGRAAARALAGGGRAGGGGVFVVGRDTRWSGPMLQAAFSAGLAAEGVDVVDVGILPTPGVAAVAADRGTAAAVVSASHNPFWDNGVKLFARGGRKLTDGEESAVEVHLAALAEAPVGTPSERSGADLGLLRADSRARDWYLSKLGEALEGRSLRGVRLVIDCANGAAAVTAKDAFAAAGADVVAVIGDDPDGTNINDGCGSTDPAALRDAVVALGADAGLAFDGDADRVIAVDGAGEVVDGDRLLALFAADLHRRGRLAGGTVVVTIMTNLGFHRAMADAGIATHETPVGDRHVLRALDTNGWSLGGEQSGHLIFRDLATTGDGVLSGLLLLDLLVRTRRPLRELAAGAMVAMPQVLRNVAVAGGRSLDSAGGVWDEVRAVEKDLGGSGRVVLRTSGTERLVRVMVEASTEEEAVSAADRLSSAVRAALGEG
jgi:phosphoglucosamine mutase